MTYWFLVGDKGIYDRGLIYIYICIFTPLFPTKNQQD